jgi:hypothetical protein
MANRIHRTGACLGAAFFVAALLVTQPMAARATEPAATTVRALAPSLNVGDVVFIHVAARPFREVAAATGSWANHLGIVIDVSGEEPLIAESTFSLSRTTTLSKFVARSEGGRVAVARLKAALTSEQKQQIVVAAERRKPFVTHACGTLVAAHATAHERPAPCPSKPSESSRFSRATTRGGCAAKASPFRRSGKGTRWYPRSATCCASAGASS